MSTELVKHKDFIGRDKIPSNASFVDIAFGNMGNYITRHNPASGNNTDLVEITLREVLNQQKCERECWDRKINATLVLLEDAQRVIDKAEEKISTQEDRILYLEKQSTMDDLTGIQNRRGFYEEFTRELNRCDRGISQGGMLVLIDLDNFKTINDTFGHQAGDACLRFVARTLYSHIRVMDVAARLGGDEFVLLLSNTTKDSAASRVQDLLWRLNNLSVAWYGEEIPVRASLGLRSFEAGDRVESIFNEADIRLYENKRGKKGDVDK